MPRVSTHFPEPLPALSAGSTHPEDLLRADRSYLAPWGRREVSIVCGAAGALLGAIAVLSVLGEIHWLLLLALPVLAVAGFLVLFFRNPARRAPAGPGLIVSPADGKVTDIESVEEEAFLGGAAIRIGIFLSVFNVHVNRAPARGRVEWVHHRKGAFHDARTEAARRENESNSIGFLREDEGGPPGVRLLVRQISGAIARRIVCPLRAGASVARGGLIGMIKYGSRTEIYIPAGSGVEVRVRVGDKVRGGTSVLAAWSVGREQGEGR
jgi:phosphatidylserine decarboxylase